MCPKPLLVAHLSCLAFAVVVLAVCSFTGQFTAAQSSQQPPFPALSPPLDLTKPLEDSSAESAFQQQHPTAAEMSRKETMASAMPRSLQYQDDEVRSAAAAMP